MNQQAQPDILRTTIMVLIIGVLLVASLWTMQAFIGPLVWATAIVVATWPLLQWVQRKVGGSRALATTVMTLVMLLIFVVPFWAATRRDARRVGRWRRRRPFVSEDRPRARRRSGSRRFRLVASASRREWQALSAGGPEQFAETIRPYVKSVAAWLLAVTGGMGGLLGHFLLTVIISAHSLCTGRNGRQRRARVREPTRGRARRCGGDPCRAIGAERGARCRRDGAGADRARRTRVLGGRYSASRTAHGHRVRALHRADRADSSC